MLITNPVNLGITAILLSASGHTGSPSGIRQSLIRLITGAAAHSFCAATISRVCRAAQSDSRIAMLRRVSCPSFDQAST